MKFITLILTITLLFLSNKVFTQPSKVFDLDTINEKMELTYLD